MNVLAVVLVVDRNPHNLALLRPFLERAEYRVQTASGYEGLDQILNSGELPNLVLIDLAGFDNGIWERCECLAAARIPIVVVTSTQGAAVRAASLAHGVRALLTKPLIVKHLLEIIHSLIGSCYAAHPAADGT